MVLTRCNLLISSCLNLRIASACSCSNSSCCLRSATSRICCSETRFCSQGAQGAGKENNRVSKSSSTFRTCSRFSSLARSLWFSSRTELCWAVTSERSSLSSSFSARVWQTAAAWLIGYWISIFSTFFIVLVSPLGWLRFFSTNMKLKPTSLTWPTGCYNLSIKSVSKTLWQLIYLNVRIMKMRATL